MKNNIRYIAFSLMIGLISLSLLGCTTGGVPFDLGNQLKASSNTQMSSEVTYIEAIEKGAHVIIELDLAVSSVKVKATEEDSLVFYQRANHDKLLAEMIVDTSGQVHKYHLKTPNLATVGINTKNAEAELSLPKDATYTLIGTIDVGDVDILLDNLEVDGVDLSVNVGDLVINTGNEQGILKTLDTSVDVGQLTIFVESAPKLEKVDARVNVGDARLSFGQVFSQGFELDCQVDIGDLTINLPKDQGAELTIEAEEFTSDIEIQNMAYTQRNKQYFLAQEGSGSVGITGSLAVSVGTLKIAGK